MADAKKTPAPVESKRDRFKRLAEKRVGDALASIVKVEGLANRARYDYTDADVEAIRIAIEQATDKAVSSLAAGKIDTVAFSLGSDE